MLADALQSPPGLAALLISIVTALILLSFLTRIPAFAIGHATDDIARRVFWNSAIPIISQLIVRGIDLAVAIAILRLLGPTGNGQYAFAIIIWLYVKTVSDFGLSLLATRDIARDPASVGRIIGETTVFRWVVLLSATIPVGIYFGVRQALDPIATPSLIAVALLLASIIPSSYSEALNSGLNGLERMELAGWINIGVNLVRAPLAVLLGASSLGVSGVALAALLSATISAIAFQRTFRNLNDRPIPIRLNMERARHYARESWPLLVNSLLVSLFFRLDTFILEAVKGDTALGIYDASYKLINLLTIIPAYAALAIFPLMARRADDPASLLRAQRTVTYVLVTIAWIAVFITMAGADVAIRILAGSEFMPEAAILLRILILFAPLSFLNGAFQYVLIARGQQRRVVPAFTAAVIFNFAANLVLVPLYGSRAAAGLTVATEVVILCVFILVTRQSVIKIHDGSVLIRLWRPTLAGALATSAAFILRHSAVYALLLSGGLFVLVAFIVRLVGKEERLLFSRIIGRVRQTASSS